MMLKEENIFLDRDLNSKDEVLNFIADKAFEKGITENRDGLLEDLWKRERETCKGSINFLYKNK